MKHFLIAFILIFTIPVVWGDNPLMGSSRKAVEYVIPWLHKILD